MNKTSLKEIIDDILLLVRNNNISESEDLSRSQIAAWVNHYRRMLWKKHLDELKAQEKSGIDILDLIDGEFIILKETGPHLLETVESNDEGRKTFTKRTVDYTQMVQETDEDGNPVVDENGDPVMKEEIITKGEFENIFANKWTSICAVHDEAGENIQYIDHIRRHYQYFRKYTFGEMTAYYQDDKHIYVQGLQDQDQLKYIYVLAIYEVPEDDADEDDDAEDEDDVQIPTWMVPDIKKLMFQNELAVMLNRPSDDSNNATLASVKPHGPQDDEE